MMTRVRSHALRLRLQGRSYNEIRKELKVAKSTLSLWLRNVVLSDVARKRLVERERTLGAAALIKRNKMQTVNARKHALFVREQAKKLLFQLTDKEFLILGASLYWAEGYKRARVRDGKERTAHPISFVNSDPDMVRAFVWFLMRTLKIRRNDIRATMRLYPHINEHEALEYWKQASGLTKTNFKKTTYLLSVASKGHRPYNRLPHGTLQIAVYNTEKFHYLMGLIEGVKNSF